MNTTESLPRSTTNICHVIILFTDNQQMRTDMRSEWLELIITSVKSPCDC